ncbi:hypothetical protein K493DRAFT_318257 [Basidiobolus meristosporus CBS 931.73]|uniref:Zip-domain-containing protein n=1 Tax=Basidiobolus meristosporus CBS 931.73 TaxID=1314790 RepID=A0A1Y1XW92_9FUNG|nr:hypothetical protein K493DRAFT_318257 [Basidiobolus meristosporus CBS 931.73]|eukprot:ORX90037.1 hypothetical protein K493DRAFT_318257 [Basidiobolus meristosporus CBS 931.73]
MFALGIVLAFLLNRLIQWISPHDICPCHPPIEEIDEEAHIGTSPIDNKQSANGHETSRLLQPHDASNASYGTQSEHCHSYTPDVTCPDTHENHSHHDGHNHANEAHVHHHHHHHHDNQDEQKQCETLHRRTSVHCHEPVCMADVAAVETETKEKLKLLSVGIQTAVAIAIHKFPEGLIMFLGNHVSSSLGFGLFLAIAIHNIPEGLMISIPLYASTGSSTKAFLYAGILGGLSQPLGALLGYILLNEIQPSSLTTLYGVVFAATSGLMTFIVVQGMLPSAFRYDTKGNTVVVWFFVGLLAIGFASASFGHV